ncbi:MAG: hypothetical protein K0Q90_4719 [Paenibacillaceae bacterium]|nr:hypothetical protein [Paenibacillaceae bacterium]
MMRKAFILSLAISLLLGSWAMAGPAHKALAAAPAESFGEWEAMRGGFGAESQMPIFHANGSLVMDGLLEDWDAGEYSAIALPSDPGQVQLGGWGGAEDLSLSARFAYDEENFYLAARVTDNVHYAVANDAMWTGDGIQLAFGNNSVYGPEYGFALVNGEAQIWRWVDGEAALDKDAVTLRANRTGNVTVYEAAIPWRAIFAQEADLQGPVLFSLLANDNDGAGRRGWIEWNESIGRVKSTSHMPWMTIGASGWIPNRRSDRERKFPIP